MKVGEQGIFIIVHVGAHRWWWGAGHHFSIMGVVGAHGQWWCHHAKGVEWGMLIIVCVGTH